MARPKSERHSTELAAEIARLEDERKRLIQSEDQRRGSLIREILAQSKGEELRALLAPLVASRDAFLFGLEPLQAVRSTPKAKQVRERATTAESAPESGRRPADSARAS
jgi:hypothetical protein